MEQFELAEKIKTIEQQYRIVLDANLPYVARLDGMCFSKYTKGFKKPFDDGFRELMVQTTHHLVNTFNAKIGYTQSDEITLVFKENENASMWWGGRTDKIICDLVSECVLFFNENKRKYFNKTNNAKFDCRVFSATEDEAIDALIWREKDCKRNSIQSIAQSHFSQTQLNNKNIDQMLEMLSEINIFLTDFEQKYIRGVYVQKSTIERDFTEEELQQLPEKHHARTNPDLKFKRNLVQIIDLPKWNIIVNKKDVVFNGKNPIIN